MPVCAVSKLMFFAVFRKALAAGLARASDWAPPIQRSVGLRGFNGFLMTPGHRDITWSDKPKSEISETPSPFSTDLMMVMIWE